MSDNPLAESPEERPLYVGSYTAEELVELASQLQGARAEVAAVTLGGTVSQLIRLTPIQAAELLALNGLGWILDHVEPLRSWLDDFTGAPEEVAAFAATWTNIAVELGDLAENIGSQIGDTDSLIGLTADAYRQHLASLAEAIGGAQVVAAAAAEALEAAADAITDIHRTIRDGISAVVVGVLESVALAPVGGVVFGPEIVAAKVASVVVRLGPRVLKVLEVLARLARSLDAIAPGLSRTLAWLARALSRGVGVDNRRISIPGLPEIDDPTAPTDADDPEFRNTPEWLQRLLDRYETDDPALMWKRKLWEGIAFNYQENPRYEPHTEVVLDFPGADGKVHHYRVDAYVPDDEIISRKYTQLASVSEATVKAYLDEFARKGYVPGTPIHGDGNQQLRGDLYLEVPEQEEAIPAWILSYAKSRIPPVTIRDVNGHEYR